MARRTPSKKPKASPKSAKKVEKEEEVEEEQPEEVTATEATATPDESGRRVTRSRRQKQKEELKSKNTGVGLSISTEPKLSEEKPNKRIVFDEDEPLEEEQLEELETVEPEKEDAKNSDEDDDDDDDVVEEVSGSAAREKAMEQMQMEERGTSTKKRKRKNRLDVKSKKQQQQDDDDDDDDEMDDSFFAQLETLKEEKKEEIKPQGKHTTFVVEDTSADAGTGSEAKPMEHNIEVVVLPEQEMVSNNVFTTFPNNALSDEALLLSRGRLMNGQDHEDGAKKKKAKTNTGKAEATWTRSGKMNLLRGKSRFGSNHGRGRPASTFVKR